MLAKALQARVVRVAGRGSASFVHAAPLRLTAAPVVRHGVAGSTPARVGASASLRTRAAAALERLPAADSRPWAPVPRSAVALRPRRPQVLLAQRRSLASDAAPKLEGVKSVRLHFGEGVCRLPLTVPRLGFDQEVEFRFAPGMSAGELVGQVESELEVQEPVSIKDHLGAVVDGALSMGPLCQSGFQVSIGDLTFNVTPPKFFGGAYGLDDKDGQLDLRNLVQKARFMRVCKVLAADTRRTISVDDFIELAGENGVPPDEAHQLLTALHRVGCVLHFANAADPRAREKVFLKPEDVTDSVFAQFGMESPTKRFADEQAAKKRAELNQLEKIFNEMHSLKTALDDAAMSAGKRWSWLGLASLSGGVGLYWWLSYVKFSWDIMEPVTYFSAAAGGICAFVWWQLTDRNFEYSDMHSLVVNHKRDKLYKERGLDLDRYESYKAEVERCREQLRTLDISGYNPALISTYLSREPMIVGDDKSDETSSN